MIVLEGKAVIHALDKEALDLFAVPRVFQQSVLEQIQRMLDEQSVPNGEGTF